MPVSPEAMFPNLKGALRNFAIKRRMIRFFQIFVVCVDQNGRATLNLTKTGRMRVQSSLIDSEHLRQKKKKLNFNLLSFKVKKKSCEIKIYNKLHF